MISIEFDAETETFVREEIAAGRFRDADAVIRAGLARLRDDRREDAALATLVAEADEDPRPSVPAADVFERLVRKQAARRERLA